MTSLRTWRRFARGLVAVCFTGDVAATLGGFVLLILIVVLGGPWPSADRVISIVGALGLYALVIWAVGDARKQTRRQPLKRVANVDDEPSCAGKP